MLSRLEELSRPGTGIVVDSVIRRGAVANAQSDDSAVQSVRRVMASTLQTVGSKGYDGFAFVLVNHDLSDAAVRE